MQRWKRKDWEQDVMSLQKHKDMKCHEIKPF